MQSILSVTAQSLPATTCRAFSWSTVELIERNGFIVSIQCNSLLVHTQSTQPWRYRVTFCLEPAYFISGVISAFLLAYFPQHNATKVIYVEVWIRAFLFFKKTEQMYCAQISH